MKVLEELQRSDLEDLARGAAFLGSGGGGNPASDCLFTESLLEEGKPLPLKQLQTCDDEEMVVLVAGIGAPLVSTERLFSGDEWVQAFELMEKSLGRAIENVAAGEIGGSNCFAGLIAAFTAKKNLLDADSLGRAFPTLNISSCALHFLPPTPAVMVDGLGNAVVFHTENPDVLERHVRALVISMGSSTMCALYPMSGKTAKKTLICGSVSLSLHIGRILKRMHIHDAIHEISRLRPCVYLGRGVITRIEQEIEKGFLMGRIIVQGDKKLCIEFQNEFLAVFHEGRPISSTPDIIALLEHESLDPLSSDQVRHGVEVEIVALSSPPLWRTGRGLRLTSPRAFGYDFEPVLIEEFV